MSFLHRSEAAKKGLLPMAASEDDITEDTFITAQNSIDNAKIKFMMPQN